MNRSLNTATVEVRSWRSLGRRRLRALDGRNSLKFHLRRLEFILALGFLAFAAGRGLAQTPPPNDDFVNAIEVITSLTGDQTIPLSGSTVGATVEPGESANAELAAHNERGTIWWKWTCPTNGSAEWFIWSPTASVMAGLFTGSSVSNLVTVSGPLSDPFNHPNPELGFGGGAAWTSADTGTTYWLAVMLEPGTGHPAGDVQGTFRFVPSPPPPPPLTNDNFANRTILVGTNVTVQGNNSGASTEPGEYTGGGAVLVFYSVWYSWTAPTNGVLRVSGSTAVPNFFLSIGTFRGSAVNALVATPATPDGGIAVWPGDTILMQVASIYYPVWGGGGGTGPFTLSLRLEVPTPVSPNDAFADRLEISAPTYHFDGSIYGATNEPGEPLPAADSRQTLWWKFTAPEAGLMNIAVSAGQFFSRLAVYRGSQLDALAPIAAVSGFRYRVEGGREYSIQLASAVVASGTFSMDTRFHSFTNDMFAGSEHLEGTNLTYYGNFTFGTPEPNEPPSPASNTVWASWAAPCSGMVHYYGPRSFQFQYVSLFTGPALGHLAPVPIVPVAHPTYGFLATEGTVYHFQFSGGAEDFAFPLQIFPYLPASNDHFSQAQVVTGSVIAFAPKSVVGATMELGEPAHLGAVPQKSIWWKWQAPRYGFLQVSASSIFIPKVTLAVYQGPAVDALGLVGKGTNQVRFPAIDGQTYYLAAAVPAEALGEITCSAQQLGMSSNSLILPDNLLGEPSWEGTAILGAQYWRMSGGVGGYVNELGGCDGTTWPVLGTGAKIWQDIPTVPGHQYAIQFAHQIGRDLDTCDCGISGVRVLWDDRDLGIAYIPENEHRFWHWEVFTAHASNTTSRVMFENVHRNLEMDAFSVVDLRASPTIVTHPSSISTVAGGAAVFVVGANCTAPLSYQWFFNQQALPGQTAPILVLDPVTPADSGIYFATVTNEFGSATSASATLFVEAATNATILVQPYGDTVPVGSYFNLSVVAAGTPPLSYQWFLSGEAVADATNRHLTLTNVQPADAGNYEVRVQNDSSSVWSLPARLAVSTDTVGGGTIDFRNRFPPFPGVTNEAPVFNIDGLTRLSGSEYVAQLYAGPSLETLRPAGQATPFRTGFSAGFFVSQIVTLPNVPPGGAAFVQVRAWEQARGTSYEEARAVGGRFGRSGVLTVTAGGGPIVPGSLVGLTSFSLRAGLPSFNVGVIEFVERNSDGTILWSLRGEPGFRYLVEKSVESPGLVWRPFQVLTNVTGTVTFSDSSDTGAGVVLYRSRLLD